MEPANVVGIAVDYPQLRAVLSARARELGLRHLEVDDIAGLQSGYTSKIFCGLRHLGDMSMGSLLGALGVHLAVVRSPVLPSGKHENLSDMAKASIEKRGARQKKISALGNKARAIKVSPEKRRQIARIASRARWQKYRASRPPRAKAAAKKIAPPVEGGAVKVQAKAAT